MLDDEKQQPEDIEGSEDTVAEATEVVESEDSAAEDGSKESGEGKEQQAPRRQRRERGGGRGARSGEAAVLEPPTEPPPPPRLYEKFKKEIIPAMVREFNYASPMQVPRLQKIVLNIGLGEALTNGRAMEAATRDLAVISGQKPIVTLARKSIANFKVR